MPKNIVKGFTILEIFVVLAIIGFFAVFAYPKISNTIKDRNVKSETNKFIAEIEQMKSKVTSGEYALAMGWFTEITKNNVRLQTAMLKKYYMNREDFAQNYPISNMASGAKGYYNCDYNTRNQKYQFIDDVISKEVRHWPNTWLCISKDGTKGLYGGRNPETNQKRTLGRVIFCHVSNTTDSGGSNRCNDTNKNDYRYMVTWDVFTNLKVYRFNMKKNQWCINKICRSMSEFN
ncbi:MAG: prepilin-type N-terminal cleavage/methylation domain-containing protein [Proteobacteria bacterium]|nr:prepilin-type N-terminal cleavage/methylation domain-containing protein [Pseudomonadota bacterium]